MTEHQLAKMLKKTACDAKERKDGTMTRSICLFGIRMRRKSAAAVPLRPDSVNVPVFPSTAHDQSRNKPVSIRHVEGVRGRGLTPTTSRVRNPATRDPPSETLCERSCARRTRPWQKTAVSEKGAGATGLRNARRF